MKTTVFCLLLCLVSQVQAQIEKVGGGTRPADPPHTSTGLIGPSLGFVFDSSSKSVRPLLGLPGAARQGAALNVPFPLDRAEAAQRGGFVLAIDQADSAVIEITAAGAQKLSGVPAGPDAIVFSPSASTAALYYRDRAVVELLEGLPGTTVVAASLNVATLPQPISALAVSDDGLVLAANSAQVFAVGNHRPAAPILTVGHLTALAFIGASQDALLADGSDNLIYRLHNGGAPVAIAGSAEGVSAPIALATSADGKRAMIANDGGAPLVLLNLADRTATKASCPCRVSGVEPMAGNAVFRVTDPAEPVIWLLDADLPAPRFVFVPAPEVRRP